jgi:4,5-DOPA dioxygenase extradiol
MNFSTLKPSPRMPVLFLGHGSPMNAILDNAYRRSWQALGRRFDGSSQEGHFPVPQLIICISAHWLTHGWAITGMAQPRTIHDFGGFPQELFDQQYPAPGSPEAALALASSLGIAVDHTEWGLDHGSWSVLKPMFPKANIPVLQLSLNWDAPPAEHYAFGQKLKGLRDKGVLIVGSGQLVHNLRLMDRSAIFAEANDAAAAPAEPPVDAWAQTFDDFVAKHVAEGSLAELANFQDLGPIAKLAHPTYEHYLPVLYAAGASDEHDIPESFNTQIVAKNMALRSIIWAHQPK